MKDQKDQMLLFAAGRLLFPEIELLVHLQNTQETEHAGNIRPAHETNEQNHVLNYYRLVVANMLLDK